MSTDPASPATADSLERSEIAELLRLAAEGDRAAFDRLMPLLYTDLRRIAHGQLGRIRPGQTLETTALVHEAYLKLADHAGAYADRGHFFAVSARAMRQILVDYARRGGASKRGGDQAAPPLADDPPAIEAEIEQVLSRLSELDTRLVRVVECRVFGGYSDEETATALGLSLRTAQRLWMRAKAWLAEEMQP